MNTELSPQNTRTCSKGHGKIANNISFRLCRNIIRLQCLELSNNMLQELIMANKGMACITRDMTDSYMAGTIISRHVGELEPLTIEKYMAWKDNQQ